MESRKLDQEPQITAQPRQISDALLTGRIAEPGLSVEPEDLGRQFLSEATEQANFESQMGGDTTEMFINDPAPSDAALTDPVWEEDRSLWQQTVERSLQSGGIDEARAQASRQGSEQNQGLQGDAEGDDQDEETAVINSNVREVSLFDHEGKMPGEVESVSVETDEQAPDARRREAAEKDQMSAVRRPGGRGSAGRLNRRAANVSRR